ncbi:MAG: TIGR03790 family protein [Puniceicoccales bacterium]
MRYPTIRRHHRFGRAASCGFLLILGLAGLFSAAQAEVSPERVVVVANSADPVSLQIAQYYMQQRAIPEKNLIEIETTTGTDVKWDEFISTIYNPLRRELVEKDWLSGTVMDQTDPEGRVQAALVANNIDFLVLCRLPVKIKEDASRMAHARELPEKREFKVNRASVDAELALLMANNPPIVGFVGNPLFGKLKLPPLVGDRVVRVARLDGPSFEAVKGCIDSALEAERSGLRGRGYIDLGGPHGDGDRWIEMAGRRVEDKGYPVTWNKEKGFLGWKDRSDAAAFYFGWWTQSINGTFADPAFRFAPGAIAIHIHSYSASQLRSPDSSWTAPLVQRGAALTVGNVYEPYLQLTHRPNLLMEGLVKGMCAGEAAYYSLPVLSWMCLYIGDPLYQPFKVDLDTQLKQMEDGDELDQYVILRKMKLLRADKQYEDSFIFGVEQNRSHSGLALALSLARQYEMRGGHAKALSSLEPWLDPDSLPVSQWGLYYKVGNFLESIGESEQSLSVMRNLLQISADTPAAQTAYYPFSIELAHKLNLIDQAGDWQSDLTQKQVEEQEKRVRKKMNDNRP